MSRRGVESKKKDHGDLGCQPGAPAGRPQTRPDLKSRNDEVRHRAAKALFDLVSSELREVSPEELSAVLDLITKQMLDTGKGDAAAKSGGILTIVVLINALDLIDVCKTDARISRFGNFLGQTLGSSTEPAVIELAAKALARLTQVIPRRRM